MHVLVWNMNADLINSQKTLTPKTIKLQQQVSAQAN